jgi:hypothetical protein
MLQRSLKPREGTIAMATTVKKKAITAARAATVYDEQGRPTGGAYAARLADLKVARKAIGDTSAARLAWVVRFVGEDPGSWHSATRTAHGDCLVALGHGGIHAGLMGGIRLPPPLAPEEVTALHTELRTFLCALVSGGEAGERPTMVQIPTEGLTEFVVRATRPGVKPAVFTMTYGHTKARTAIFQAVKNLVLNAGAQLLACPVCGGPFVAVRKQRFCSTKCAQRVRNDRKAERRPRRRAAR